MSAAFTSSEALQRTLTSALFDPVSYNRIVGAQEPAPPGAVKLLSGLAHPAQFAVSRPAAFVIPRAIGPALSDSR